jgi:hypothetical protein
LVETQGEEMAFDISKAIIFDLERIVAKEKRSFLTIFECLRREVYYPGKLLRRGFGLFSRDILKFSVLVLLGLIVMKWLEEEFAMADVELLAQFSYPLIFLIALVISMFSAPSSYSFCGVKDAHLRVVLKRLANSGIRNTELLSPIKSNIQQFESRVRVRIIGLRAFMVLCWTGFVYLYSEFNKAIINSRELLSMNDIWFVSFALLWVLVLYVAIESYSKVNTLIFRAALLGCNEYEYFLAGEAYKNNSSNNQAN